MDLARLFDSFYNRFILRDVFGKIVPGFILIVGILILLEPSPSICSKIKICPVAEIGYLIFSKANSISLLAIVLFSLGIGWLAGFAIQRLGEILGVLIEPRNGTEEQEWLDLMIKFDRNTRTREWERNLRERLVVIKEACGNSSVALGIINPSTKCLTF